MRTTDEPPSGSGDPDGPTQDKKKKSKKSKVLTEEKLRRIKEDYGKRGVVYVSRCVCVWLCVCVCVAVCALSSQRQCLLGTTSMIQRV